MNYEYKSPEESGYIKVKVNKRAWNKNFQYKHAKFTFRQTVDVYYHPEKGFIIEKYIRFWMKPLAIVLLPLSLLIYGVANYKEIVREHLGLVFQKKYGSFTKDAIYQKSDIFSELVKTIKQP